MTIDVIFVHKYLLQSSPDVYHSAPISLYLNVKYHLKMGIEIITNCNLL